MKDGAPACTPEIEGDAGTRGRDDEEEEDMCMLDEDVPPTSSASQREPMTMLPRWVLLPLPPMDWDMMRSSCSTFSQTLPPLLPPAFCLSDRGEMSRGSRRRASGSYMPASSGDVLTFVAAAGDGQESGAEDAVLAALEPKVLLLVLWRSWASCLPEMLLLAAVSKKGRFAAVLHTIFVAQDEEEEGPEFCNSEQVMGCAFCRHEAESSLPCCCCCCCCCLCAGVGDRQDLG